MLDDYDTPSSSPPYIEHEIYSAHNDCSKRVTLGGLSFPSVRRNFWVIIAFHGKLHVESFALPENTDILFRSYLKPHQA